MNCRVPWSDLVALVFPYLPEGKRGRPPFPPEAMLHIHLTPQWFNLAGPAIEKALHDVPRNCRRSRVSAQLRH